MTALCKNLDAYNLNHCDLLYTSFLKTYFATFLSILSNPLLRDTNLLDVDFRFSELSIMSEDEGTPMEGPLPLELQQIRADTQREEAALAAAKAALAAQRRKSEVSYQC